MSLKQKGQVERLKQFNIKKVYSSIKNTDTDTWMLRYAELMADPYKLVDEYQFNTQERGTKGRERFRYKMDGSDMYEIDTIGDTYIKLPTTTKFEDLAGDKGYLNIVSPSNSDNISHISVLRRKPVEYFGENEEMLSRLPLRKYPSSRYHRLQDYYELMDSNVVDYRQPISSFYNSPLNRFVNYKQIVLPNPKLERKFQTDLPTCSLWTEFFSKHPEKTMEELDDMLQQVKDSPDYQYAMYNIIDQNPDKPVDQIAEELQETIMYHKLMKIEDKGTFDASFLSPEEIVELRGIGRRKRK
jgi:hypothetical protein